MAYLEASGARRVADSRRAIEHVRIGMIFANSQRAYDAWLSDVAPRRGLDGAALERYIAGLAASNPDLVTVVN